MMIWHSLKIEGLCENLHIMSHHPKKFQLIIY